MLYSPDWCSCPDGKSNGDPACFPPNPDEVVFVPMVWGVEGFGPPWKNYTDPDVAKDMDTVLGYNEPNRPDQSNIPPEEAAVLWSEFTQKYNDKVELFFRFMYKDFMLICIILIAFKIIALVDSCKSSNRRCKQTVDGYIYGRM